jgi:hypothetical protein
MFGSSLIEQSGINRVCSFLASKDS